ncbi:MAG: hypothetical protein KGJ57_17630 [Sphingomonadales bacterium]|nr:hypothetical protein [Sphingomonadales bacterium]MDE2171220.1 hypothetical protein [Sphingomonadales bacterium]
MGKARSFYLVWNPQGMKPPKFRHPWLASAKAEARRLAIANPGHEFFVLETVSSAKVQTVIETDFERDHDDDGVPF